MRAGGFAPPHAFTQRQGGTSEGAYASLNLGLSTGDAPDRVARNRELALSAFGTDASRVLAVRQVHGARVAAEGAGWFEAEADAMTSGDPRLTLVIGAADCLPVLVHDPASGAVGAAHCGWRGLRDGVIGAVVDAMRRRHGSDPSRLGVALGPCIGPCCYQVGAEVVGAFRRAGFPFAVAVPDRGERFRLDLPAAARWALTRAGVRPDAVVGATACTHCDPVRFYSHRRDGGRTGRHWAMVRASGPARTGC